MSDSAIRQKLKEMAQLSILANRLSQVQETNLKHYPFVFFDGVKSVKIDFNIAKVSDDGVINTEEHHVSYYLELDENQTLLDKRFFAIAEATRMLFWNDLKVRVFFNNKLAYETKDE